MKQTHLVKTSSLLTLGYLESYIIPPKIKCLAEKILICFHYLCKLSPCGSVMHNIIIIYKSKSHSHLDKCYDNLLECPLAWNSVPPASLRFTFSSDIGFLLHPLLWDYFHHLQSTQSSRHGPLPPWAGIWRKKKKNIFNWAKLMKWSFGNMIFDIIFIKIF